MVRRPLLATATAQTPWGQGPESCVSHARHSRRERVDEQPLDGREVFDVGGEQRSLVFDGDGGGGDQCIGQSQPVGQREIINQC